MAIESSYQRQFDQNIAGNESQIFDYDPYIGNRGDFKKTEDINVVIRSIRTLLLTPLGHYPFDPEYGSLLYQQLFEPFDDETLQRIDFEIRDRIAQYEDRCKVEKVEFKKTQDGKSLIVDVNIDRNGVKGKVDIYLSAQKRMFGLEDELTATDY